MPREVIGTGRRMARSLWFWVWGFLLDIPRAPRNSTCGVGCSTILLSPELQRLGNEECGIWICPKGSLNFRAVECRKSNPLSSVNMEY